MTSFLSSVNRVVFFFHVDLFSFFRDFRDFIYLDHKTWVML